MKGHDLDVNCTPADFRAIAITIHNEFFGEHPDNTIYTNFVKCLLARIHDERTCKKTEEYQFQIFYKNGNLETATEVFDRIDCLYRQAYQRYVDPSADDFDGIDPNEFTPEQVKFIVQTLQGIRSPKVPRKR